MKRGGPPKRHARLRYRSVKREEEAAERRIVVLAAFARDRRQCRAAKLVPEVGCAGPNDAHEIIPRSAWRAGYLVLDNVLTICRAHHDWVGEHVQRAAQLGLHGFSWERPDRAPLRHNQSTQPKEET